MSKIFVDACFRRPTPYTPVWMMRQAGRYLKEYMEVRSKAGNFLNLCHNPKLAAEVTIQPLDIVGVDAAILFSDILVIPNEMGMHLEFLQGEGPVFKDPIKTEADLDKLIGGEESANKLTYVYETIKLLKEQLPQDKALIGSLKTGPSPCKNSRCIPISFGITKISLNKIAASTPTISSG